jgi:CheY-like chemotaxis protein
LSSCVLIVDDDADLSETLARLLGRFGHTCLVAASGPEAVDLMETESPDLIVTDLHMPGMNGISVARQARRKRPPIPVVLMTAYPAAETRREAQIVGGIFHLAKPFANADMLDVVERALASSKDVTDHGLNGV